MTRPSTTLNSDQAHDGCDTTVLHALRVKGMATAGALSVVAALDDAAVEAALGRIAGRGHATFVDRRAVWRITADGREHHRTVVVGLLDDPGRSRLRSLYEDFLTVNGEAKQACSDWQIRDGEPNPHDDGDYDQAVLDRVASVYDRVDVLLGDMSMVCRRLDGYRSRLGAALEAVRHGDTRRLTGFGCASFHELWMELHEDLIQLLGIDRAAEGSS
ncbi:hypothetical protein ABZT51_24370 [Streptomyces sp. NPDC005373]|uniref:hypothetical protein n=1 Tax=Streptomyces sp. NPDC005373 TaxID=3156879 RepID=UPI0033A399E1